MQYTNDAILVNTCRSYSLLFSHDICSQTFDIFCGGHLEKYSCIQIFFVKLINTDVLVRQVAYVIVTPVLRPHVVLMAHMLMKSLFIVN